MTELYPSTPAGPSRRSTLRAAGGGTLLLGLGLVELPLGGLGGLVRHR